MVNKKAENDPVQSVDGKKPREGILVDKEEFQRMMIVLAARVAHEANRAYCQSKGDDSQPRWDDAPDWQKQSSAMGVIAVQREPGTTSAQSHSLWMAHKRAEGWVLGPVKDALAKVHPCMVPYDDLPETQKFKDRLFGAVVRACLGIPVGPEVVDRGDDESTAINVTGNSDCVAPSCSEPDTGCDKCADYVPQNSGCGDDECIATGVTSNEDLPTGNVDLPTSTHGAAVDDECKKDCGDSRCSDCAVVLVEP